MARVVGNTIFSRALEGLAHLVSASTTFQAEVRRATPTLALTHIHYPYGVDEEDPLGGPPEAPRPRAIITPGNRWESHRSSQWGFDEEGDLFLTFEFLPKPSLRERSDQQMDFQNRVGAILNEMQEASGRDRPLPATETYLNVARIMLVDGPGECERRNERELFYGVTFAVDWR